MKAKIFSKLKQEYAALGLGDEILQGLADSLAKMGLVTDENIDLVVSVQKENLENLQKQNDARVAKALAKQKQKMQEELDKKAEDEKAAAQKAEEERKAAEQAQLEADKKAKEEADKAAKDAEKSAAEKAAAEAEAKRIEELKKAGISQEFLDFYKSEKEKSAAEREGYQKQLAGLAELQKQMEETMNQQKASHEETIKKLLEANTTLQKGYDDIVKEKEAAEVAKKAAEREQFIVSQAKLFGIPDWRINEGFVIGADADEESIKGSLSKIAENISTQMLPTNKKAMPMGNAQELSQSEIDGLATQIIKNIK